MVVGNSNEHTSSHLHGPQSNQLLTNGHGPSGHGHEHVHGAINPSNGSSINQYIQQMMMNNPSLLSQPHGNQNQMIYQNSLLDVANMVNPLQVLPSSVGTSPTSINMSSTIPCSNHDPLSGPNAWSTATSSNVNPLLSTNFPTLSDQSPAMTLGGVRIPAVPPNTTTAQQVQIAAAAAAAEAAPPKGYHGPTPGGVRKRDRDPLPIVDTNDLEKAPHAAKRTKRNASSSELTEEEKKQLNRDRNRQHARSTRLRKKAYVNKIKELVDGLHVERSEEARKRRVAVQHLAEVQSTRRKVIFKFLQFHAGYEYDPRKWETILEDGFFLKQPLTPFRSFRTHEMEVCEGRDCRISMGTDQIICDTASLSVMIENVGSRSTRWQYIKRDELLCREEGRTGKRMPGSIVRGGIRLQHAISSLSSSSASSIGTVSGSDEEKRKQKLTLLNRVAMKPSGQNQNRTSAKKVSSSSSGGSSSLSNQAHSNNDFHDYHAQPLPDPRLDGGSTDSDSPTNASDNAVAGKHLCTDSSSGEDEKPSKKVDKKRSVPPNVEILSKRKDTKTNAEVNTISTSQVERLKQNKPLTAVTDPSVSSNSERDTRVVKPVPTRSSLPPNIARSGGISHNIRPVGGDLSARLSTAPAVALPPFAGIGKRPGVVPSSLVPAAPSSTMNSPNKTNQPIAPTPQITNFVQSKALTCTSIVSKGTTNKNNESGNGMSSSVQHNVIDPDNGTTSSDDSSFISIHANYHVNEDDMLLTDNVLMCPFIFRTQDAVRCGALAECIVPGMLRAEFSERNKLLQLEMVYDAMGFMQQLERASCNEGRAHIIPNTLETSLQPNVDEARVITTAKSPYLIVSVNELWTRITKYTQMEAEQKELSILHGKRTNFDAGRRQGKPIHDSSTVANGQPACSTNIYYDKFGRDFISFVSSYPVSNSVNETTHILHVFKELKEKDTATEIHFR